jgi:hypothetical protein
MKVYLWALAALFTLSFLGNLQAPTNTPVLVVTTAFLIWTVVQILGVYHG